MINLEVVKAVGFDLDQTLYPDKPEIQDRVRMEIAKRLLSKNNFLRTKEEARKYFEERYAKLQSGTKVLREAGYDQPDKTMDYCLARAEVLDLIDQNPRLVQLFRRIKEKYDLFLITSSPEELAKKKLERIGLDHTMFSITLYSDTQRVGSKSEGEAFKYYLKNSKFQPSEHLYIGDRLKSDILPAKSVGMQTAAVWSTIKEADQSFSTINDLEELFK